MENFNYITSQFRQINAASGQIMLKVNRDGKETHWITISPELLASIQNLMEQAEANQ